MRDQTFMTSTQRSEEVLKFVTCLQILLFLNNRSIVHFANVGWVWGGVKNQLFFVDFIIV